MSGCASSSSPSTYSRKSVNKSHSVRLGTVESVRYVKLEGTRSGAGAVTGAVAGGIAGSTIGHNTGSRLGAVGGAAIGAAGGAFAEEKLTGSKGLEIVVKLDSGKSIVVAQKADILFSKGNRVRVIKSPEGETRITHI